MDVHAAMNSLLVYCICCLHVQQRIKTPTASYDNVSSLLFMTLSHLTYRMVQKNMWNFLSLSIYSHSITNVVFIVHDNCFVNKRISKDMHVLMIGYSRHRLNLPVKRFMIDYENVIGWCKRQCRHCQS
ncbi:hypothetical protein AC1031_018514 [Aphanomyces cochlioides]|nr:hypothetical protein AC1031_018514 [Aphanomyces cochlioides]